MSNNSGEGYLIKVNHIHPLEDIVQMIKGKEGASLNYNEDDKTLSLYISLSNPTKQEIRAISRGKLKFAFYPNERLETSLMMVAFEEGLIFELIYDINVLPTFLDGRVEGNRFDIFLLDSDTGVVKGLRVIGLSDAIMLEINNMTKNDMRYSSSEYKAWIDSEVGLKDLETLWKESIQVDWTK